MDTVEGCLSCLDTMAACMLVQVLSRTFLAIVVVLDGAWRPGPDLRASPQQAASFLGMLACLQFCRLRTSIYSGLLKDMLSAVVEDDQVGVPALRDIDLPRTSLGC